MTAPLPPEVESACAAWYVGEFGLPPDDESMANMLACAAIGLAAGVAQERARADELRVLAGHLLERWREADWHWCIAFHRASPTWQEWAPDDELYSQAVAMLAPSGLDAAEEKRCR